MYGQETNLSRKILWKPAKALFETDKSESTDKFILFFENAIYETDKNLLPVYSELIPVNENFEISIENEVFVSLNQEEIRNIVDLKFIGSSVGLKSKMVVQRKKSYLAFSFCPLRKNNTTGEFEKMISFEIKLSKKNITSTFKSIKAEHKNSSVLSSGNWIKIKIDKSGIYKLSFDELQNLGVSDPENIRIFGNGGKMLSFYNSDARPDDLTEIKIWKNNDIVYFYGVGPVQWNYDKSTGLFRHSNHLYSDYAYYFLSSDAVSQTNNQVINLEQSTGQVTNNISQFNDFAYHEIDSVNLIQSGRMWVAENFDFQTEYEFSFNFPNLITGSKTDLRASLLARSPLETNYTIELDNSGFTTQDYSRVSYDYTSTYATQRIENFSTTSSGENPIRVKIRYNKATASSEGWLDFIEINALRGLKFDGTQMAFRSTSGIGTGNISEFNITGTSVSTLVWDISDPFNPGMVITSFSGNDTKFRIETDSLREFIAWDPSSAYSPITKGEEVGKIENQNLHGIQSADMIIVAHPDFLQYAEALKEIHQTNDNLNVYVVTTNQVYNEFSSGAPDVSAIRDFMKMIYDRATAETELPRYLCLFGDGSYDNKRNSTENTNFILTYQSDNSLSPTQSFVTDDFFGLLDDDEGGHEGLLDIGIGRIPVKNKTEASEMIQKIRNYLEINSYGDWRNRICFIADDEDYSLHMEQADEISQIIKDKYPVFNTEKIYLDAFQQQSTSAGQRYPDVNLSIDNQIEKGILVLNYTGHGNENGLAEERVIVVDQIKKWNNNFRLPVFMTATCEFSRFDNFKKVTAGEQVFLNPNGGAICLFTTTRLVYASPNFTLNKNFYSYFFENDPLRNKKYAMGDIMMLTKNSTGSIINSRNFTLLGDPAIEPAYARQFVKTLFINGKPVNSLADTLKALQKVTITGEVQDLSGQKMGDYNGVVFPVVYDKKLAIKTLNNDGEGSFSYQVMNSQLFKGKASVTNGDFRFEFIVPKDIRYNLDTGKVSYYSTNYILNEDSKGSYNNIMIGGLDTNYTGDKSGPELNIYLNDENFVSGGITNQKPKLLVKLKDDSGINTTGTGIGHDIMATIDQKANLQFKLNDYYESDIDNFKSGKVEFSLPVLEPGEHSLRLKAWDAVNNSSEDSIIFIVKNNEKFEINHVLNYPNPFSTNTSFFFEHNRPGELLEVYIHIFTVTGRIIKTIHHEVISQGFRSDGIPWDGKDDFGNKPGRGVYFYRLAVRTLNGEFAEKTEKLLILN